MLKFHHVLHKITFKNNVYVCNDNWLLDRQSERTDYRQILNLNNIDVRTSSVYSSFPSLGPPP